LGKSPTTAFGPPLLETKSLDSDLVEHILSSRVAFDEWNLTCTQIRSMETPVSLGDLKDEQDHSMKAIEHIQTPRKVKPKLNSDSEEWFVQEDDEDSLSQPFENTSTFMTEKIYLMSVQSETK